MACFKVYNGMTPDDWFNHTLQAKQTSGLNNMAEESDIMSALLHNLNKLESKAPGEYQIKPIDLWKLPPV